MSNNWTEEIAIRLKEVITDNGGYEKISEQTGISKSTLFRIANGKSDPKFKDVLEIVMETGSSLQYVAYGVKGESVEEQTAHVIAKALTGLATHLKRAQDVEKNNDWDIKDINLEGLENFTINLENDKK